MRSPWVYAAFTSCACGFRHRQRRAPLQNAVADLPGTDVVPNGYTASPKKLFKAVPNPPGKGGDVTLVTTISLPTAPYESNTLWQGVSKAMGVNLVPSP